MKKTYKSPKAAIVELHTDIRLLLPTSGGRTTDNAFARHHGNCNWEEDDWDE